MEVITCVPSTVVDRGGLNKLINQNQNRENHSVIKSGL